MAKSDKTDSSKPKSSAAELRRLFQKHFSNPQAPSLEEIGRMAEEVLLRNSELESKVGNLKKTVQQLEAYRDRYVDLYELAPIGYLTLDEEGYVQEINIAGSQLLGADRDELIGYPFENHVGTQDRAAFLKRFRKCCREHQVLNCDVGIVRKDGKSITAHLRGVPIESPGAEASFCKIAMADISERKAAEEALKASEANYRTVFNTANDAIFVHDAETGAILDANQKANEMYGYTVAEIRAANIGVLSEGSPPYSGQDAAQWIKLANTGEPQVFTWRSKDKGGRVFWTEVNLKRMILNGVPRLLAIVRDISERKEAEEALRASEERFRTMADYTYDWEYWRGMDGKFCYVSPSCQRITGYAADEFMADPALLERIVHPDDRRQVRRHLRGESPAPGPHTAEYRIISRAGEERWIEHICQPVYGVDQRWLGQRASNRDITDRKRAELELRERLATLEKRLAERAGQGKK
jgi:PAS domain S-box-containing protein